MRELSGNMFSFAFRKTSAEDYQHRFANPAHNPLIPGLPAFTRVCIRHHLGELLRIGFAKLALRVPTVLKQDSQGFPNGPVHYSGDRFSLEWGVQSIRAAVEIGDPACDGLLLPPIQVPFGKMHGVTEAQDHGSAGTSFSVRAKFLPIS
jgi:hypothetical protein